jgi:hypothetical protein
MTGLQETFYIMGIIFMSITFLLTLALVAAVFVIRSKVNKIHATIENKINKVTNLAEKGGELSALAGSVVARRAKKAIKKAKR